MQPAQAPLWRSWLLWIAAVALPWSMLPVVMAGLYNLVGGWPLLWFFAGLLGVSGTGVWLGFLQWLLLRRQGVDRTLWIAATTLGVLLGHIPAMHFILLDWYVAPGARLEWDGLLIGASFGFLLGAAQRPLIRLWSPRASWWVVANSLGWGLGEFMSDVARVASGLVSAPFMEYSVTGLIAGVVTGLILLQVIGTRTGQFSPPGR